MSLSQRDVETIAEGVGPFLKALRERIETLERELEAVRKSAPRHTGKYEAGSAYMPGEEVAWKGCTWRAKHDGVTGEPPGPGWWLVAKGAG
jgi:hypothetical protein